MASSFSLPKVIDLLSGSPPFSKTRMLPWTSTTYLGLSSFFEGGRGR